MRYVVLAILVSALVASVAVQAADKPTPEFPPNVPQLRQGGDTIETAVVVDHLPLSTTGTTTGYADDYDEVCPYTGSTSPDVIYVYAPGDMPIPCEYADIDLYGSLYDTKVYVYDSQLNLMACNDDFHSDYTSRIEMMEFFHAETYYIVVDGYGGDHGEYNLNINEYESCYVACPPGYLDEGEPPLQNDVPDTYNSGCDGSSVAPVIAPLSAGENGMLDLCGRMGWITIDGEIHRDIDWFSLVVGATGSVTGIYEDNLGGMIQVITPGGCDGLQVLQTIEVWPCYQQELTITGDPGSEIWLRIATRDGEPSCGGYTPQEWDYTLELSGLQAAVAVEAHSWSTVKGLFSGKATSTN